MEIRDLERIHNTGVFITVRFKKSIWEMEVPIDVGMIADVKAFGDAGKDVQTITFDFSLYMTHNRRKMEPSYFDDNGTPRLTAEESGSWPDGDRETVYFDEKDDILDYVDIIKIT